MKHAYRSITITLESDLDFLTFRGRQDGSVEILDIAVGTERGRGNGRRLVNTLIENISRHRPKYHLVYAITRSSNIIAQEFYKALDFRVVAVLASFYVNDADLEDAIMFGKDL